MSSDIRFNQSAVRAGAAVSEGWKFISPNYGLYLGMTVVFLLIMIAIGFIPYVGDIANQFLYGIFACGIFIAILASARGQEPQFAMLFEGFSRIVPCVLIMLIQMIPSFLILTLIIPYLYFSGGANPLDPNGMNPEQLQQLFNPQMIGLFVLVYLVVLALSIILKIFLFFALPLVADRNVGIGDALSLSFKAATGNIGGLLLLIILEILMVFGGILLFCIGIIFVLPVILAAEIAAYRQVFPDDQMFFNNEPPRPDAYGGNYGMPQNPR